MDYSHYDIEDVFCIGYNDEESGRAEDRLSDIGLELDYTNRFSPDGRYCVEYRFSDHERDSSGDVLIIYRIAENVV